MGTPVTGFLAGCLAGGIVTIFGTGSGGDIGDQPPHRLECAGHWRAGYWLKGDDCV